LQQASPLTVPFQPDVEKIMQNRFHKTRSKTLVRLK
jgi:hypothetical protein